MQTGVFIAKRNPFNGLFGVFADSMPDGWGNLLLDRYLASNGISLPAHELNFPNEQSDLNTIAQQIAEILAEKAEIPTILSVLEQTGSSGGARPKVIVNHNKEAWMVKFPSSTDNATIGKQEYFYSVLARQCGIEMSETKLFEGKYFGTKLFDRTQTERFHVHSAAGLLHADFRYPSLDYVSLAKTCNLLTKNTFETEKLLRLMVFNACIENMDDHAKNFSFIYNKGNWKLSPAYDLLKSTGFGGQHATSFAGVGNPRRTDLMKVANEISFPEKEMKNIIDSVFEVCLASEIGTELGKRNL